MREFFFGKAMTVTVEIHGVTAGDAPEIVTSRLYEDKPSTEQFSEAVYTGGFEEVTSWTNVETGVYTIDFAALTDDDPTYLNTYETFWVVTRFKYDTGGATVFTSNTIRVFRPSSWINQIGAVRGDLTSREPELGSLLSTAALDAHLSDAEEWILDQYEGAGLEPERIGNLERLKLANIYFALSQACFALAGDNAEAWFTKADKYKADAKEKLAEARAGYDTDGDTQISENEEAAEGVSLTLVQR